MKPVPMDMSVNWCWPPHTDPKAEWYTMTYKDSNTLDSLHKAEGNHDTPTHEQKLVLMAKHKWQMQRIGNMIHCRSS